MCTVISVRQVFREPRSAGQVEQVLTSYSRCIKVSYIVLRYFL